MFYDFLVFCSFYLVIAILTIVIFCIYNKSNNKTAELLFFAALFRMLVTYGYYYYAQHTSSDALSYYYYSTHTGFIYSDFIKPGTLFLDNFAALFSIPISFFENPFLMLFVPFSLLGFIGSLLFYKTIQSINHLKEIEKLTFSFFLPNLTFWTSNLGKDSIIYFGLMAFLYGIMKDKKDVKSIFCIILGALIIYMIRPHVLFFILAGFLIGFFMDNNKFSFRTFAILTVVLIGFLLTYQQIFKYVGITIFPESETGENVQNIYDQSIRGIHYQQKQLATGGSATSVSPVKYIFTPYYIVNFLCAPFFWQVRKPIHLIGALESILFQIMIIYILRNNKLLVKDKSVPFKNTWLIFIVITSAIMGATFTNFGLTIRQRCMVIPFLVFLYLLVRSAKYKQQRIKKNAASAL